jgi:hypothetical protein
VKFNSDLDGPISQDPIVSEIKTEEKSMVEEGGSEI